MHKSPRFNSADTSKMISEKTLSVKLLGAELILY